MTSDQFDSAYHAPVMVAEVLGDLAGASTVLDGTLGGGGHSLALLEQRADVTGLDRDPGAIATATARLGEYASAGRFRAVLGNYADVDVLPALAGRAFDGILLDLGVSSHQFDDAGRGFSFREGAPLDMRMEARSPAAADATTVETATSTGGGPTAADLLNNADEAELARIFREYGDEPRAGRFAREIVRRRGNRAFETSDDLVGAIRGTFGPRTGPPDFARYFQALRIAVNDELEGLARALPALRDRLTPGGVLTVIAYHSGEDRIVKHAFREWSLSCVCPPKQFQCTCRGRSLGGPIRKRPSFASDIETARNPRARSAHLRSWRRGRDGAP